jgi:hypothetical protein
MQSACALYCRLWLVQFNYIFPYYPINGTMFGITLLNLKCVSWFSLQLLRETFLTLRRTERDIIVHVRRFSCKACCCEILMKTEFSWQFFEKFSNFKFHENCVQWEPSCSKWTEGRMNVQKWRCYLSPIAILRKRLQSRPQILCQIW